MRLVLRSLLEIVLAVVALAAAWLGLDQFGWTKINSVAPYSAQVLDVRYASAAIAAEPLVRAARKEFGAPGLSVAVSVNGTVVWTAGVGWADIATNRPVSAATIFRIGSTSKAITATALARMVDSGVIAFDAPISRYMPDLPNKEWAPLTARQLTSHTAGLAGYAENRDLWGVYQSLALTKHYDNVVDSLEIFDGTKLVSPPGTRFLYSSFDVDLLSAVMQTAEGKPFLALLGERVLQPLGMNSTGGDGKLADTSNVAMFCRVRGERAKSWRRVDLSQKWASGGLLATSSDLARLCGGWFDPAFIAPQTVRAFLAPQRLASGEVNEQGYAHGWRARPESDALGPGTKTARFHHGGVMAGALSWLVCYPEKRLGIAMNINARAQPFDALSAKEPAITRVFFDAAPSQPR